ncbi:MAG: hypothetical protein KDA41_22995 [Planctomycetales bacterium]|nr:hypothetical protein [Planctomycetales bacterium]
MSNDSADIVFLDEPIAAEAVIDAEVLAPRGLPCAACGAPVEAGDAFCTHCGQAVESAAPVVPPPFDPNQPPGEKHKSIECRSCGAQIQTDPDHRSYTCPFCDSTYVDEYVDERTGREPPEFVIGFAVTPDEAREKFRAWIGQNSIFRPGDLAQAKIEGKLAGIYIPFWRFTMLAQSRWTARIGEYWYRTETYTTTDAKGNTVTRTRQVRETEWWSLAGQHHLYHRDYLVSGSKGLAQADADRVKPFQLPALKRYAPSYVAGWIAEEYSIEKDAALAVCKEEFYRREQASVAQFLPGDTHASLQVSTRFSQETSDLCLLPVYILAYRHGEKLHRFFINGQTGKVHGRKPWSGKRIAAAIGVGVAVLLAIILTLLALGVFASHG